MKLTLNVIQGVTMNHIIGQLVRIRKVYPAHLDKITYNKVYEVVGYTLEGNPIIIGDDHCLFRLFDEHKNNN